MTFGEYCAARPLSYDDLDSFARWVLNFPKPAIRDCRSKAEIVWWATATRRADPQQGDIGRKLWAEYRAARQRAQRIEITRLLGENPRRAAAMSLLGDAPPLLGPPPSAHPREAAYALL